MMNVRKRQIDVRSILQIDISSFCVSVWKCFDFARSQANVNRILLRIMVDIGLHFVASSNIFSTC